jgi:hypothetical protein
MISQEEKNQFKALFNSWMETVERKSELSKESKALTDNAAALLNTKPGKIVKLFKIMKKKYEEAEDELQELSDLLEEVSD